MHHGAIWRYIWLKKIKKVKLLSELGSYLNRNENLWENSTKVVNNSSVIEVTNYSAQKIGFLFGIFII